jgi:hypothetical protein
MQIKRKHTLYFRAYHKFSEKTPKKYDKKQHKNINTLR